MVIRFCWHFCWLLHHSFEPGINQIVLGGVKKVILRHRLPMADHPEIIMWWIMFVFPREAIQPILAIVSVRSKNEKKKRTFGQKRWVTHFSRLRQPCNKTTRRARQACIRKHDIMKKASFQLESIRNILIITSLDLPRCKRWTFSVFLEPTPQKRRSKFFIAMGQPLSLMISTTWTSREWSFPRTLCGLVPAWLSLCLNLCFRYFSLSAKDFCGWKGGTRES